MTTPLSTLPGWGGGTDDLGKPIAEIPTLLRVPKTCNRHDDCERADLRAKERGASFADHCHDECCEDCFGY